MRTHFYETHRPPAALQGAGPKWQGLCAPLAPPAWRCPCLQERGGGPSAPSRGCDLGHCHRDRTHRQDAKEASSCLWTFSDDKSKFHSICAGLVTGPSRPRNLDLADPGPLLRASGLPRHWTCLCRNPRPPPWGQEGGSPEAHGPSVQGSLLCRGTLDGVCPTSQQEAGP